MSKLSRKMMLALDDDTYQTMMDFAEVSEKPAATLVREILQASLPQIKQSIRMLQQIKAGLLSEGVETMYQTAAEAQLKLFQAQQEFVEGAKVVRDSGATREQVAEAAKSIKKTKRAARK